MDPSKNQRSTPLIIFLFIPSRIYCILRRLSCSGPVSYTHLDVYKRQVLKELGLGYLTLGEETPSLSGGEAQRLKLASEMGKLQNDSLFIFDEPTIGLHPLDVQTLLKVFQTLMENGATVVVIEHDLDVIRNADYIIDMGPGGGADGGRIVACETPEKLAKNPFSQTGHYL